MATAPSNPPAEPTPPPADADAPAMRDLDEAVGGGQVPAGMPLGGPVFKTNAQLNAERLKAEEERAAAEKAEADAAPAAPSSAPVSGDPLT